MFETGKNASLILNLAGPMQSWGVDGKFSFRETLFMPTKSGVIGILCAAMGIERDDVTNLHRVSKIRMAAAPIKSGNVERDYHTIKDVLKASGGIKDTELTERLYLADWHFVVVLEGAKELLMEVKQALLNPKWVLFLGRKSCAPSCPIVYGDCLVDQSIEELFLVDSEEEVAATVFAQIEDLETKFLGTELRDVPVNYKSRTHSTRRVMTKRVSLKGVEHALFKPNQF